MNAALRRVILFPSLLSISDFGLNVVIKRFLMVFGVVSQYNAPSFAFKWPTG